MRERLKFDVRIQRIYAPAEPDARLRVLVDRVWPRGVSKERAALDHWIPEIGPTTALRKWFGHDPARWDEFKQRYTLELENSRKTVDQLLAWAAAGPVTLLYSARDEKHNQAVAILEHLESLQRESPS